MGLVGSVMDAIGEIVCRGAFHTLACVVEGEDRVRFRQFQQHCGIPHSRNVGLAREVRALVRQVR